MESDDAKPADDESGAQAPDFERSMAELEALIARMEKGDLSLEETLSHYERGVFLKRHCEAALKSAEQKIDALVGPDQDDVTAFDERE